MKSTKVIFLFILLNVAALTVYSQRTPRIGNLPKYDLKFWHFGFFIGFNQMDFALKPVSDLRSFDSLSSVINHSLMGFTIGIIMPNIRLGDNFDVRFTPAFILGEREIHYTFIGKRNVENIIKKKIESNFVDFPIMIKFKSDRIYNCRAYVLAGAKYALDVASQSDKKNQFLNEEIIKLYRSDFCYEFGVGFDFYFEYFKFSMELKMSYGTTNVLKRDETIYTRSIDKLNSKLTLFSLYFE